ncbi:MAG TPA: Veg protein [Ruminiclostridium sp.]|nr:Veg protein [Ruminiclostridium sp.]
MDRKSLSQIRKQLECLVGKRVELRANKGRKKISVKVGIVDNVYPSVFTVRLENEYNSVRKVSYNYTDILTHTVEVRLMSSSDIDKIAL